MPNSQIGSREARKRWRDLLDAASGGNVDTIIKRNGKPVAALIPYQDYVALKQALNDLRESRRTAETYRALKHHSGRTRSYRELLAELENEEVIHE